MEMSYSTQRAIGILSIIRSLRAGAGVSHAHNLMHDIPRGPRK